MSYNIKDGKLVRRKQIILPLIILSNLFPLYGAIHYNWTLFSIVYLYWIELIIISTFSLLKIILAQGDVQITWFGKLKLAMRFFIIRSLIFLFYLSFIIVFLGLYSNLQHSENTIKNLEVIYLKDTFYKITLLGFILYNTLEFVIFYILNNTYKTALPNDYYSILDVHIFVVHIVVVLGTFTYQWAVEKFHLSHRHAMIACVVLFVVVKIIADICKQSYSNESTDEVTNKYI